MKINFLSLLFCLSLVQMSWAQFPIGRRTVTFTDPSRANRSISAEVCYPATSAGSNANFANGQFPLVVFGHGFVMTYTAYDVVWQALVPEGYIVVLPTTEGSFSPSHGNFGQDIAFLVNAFRNENTNSSSVYFGKLSGSTAVMGHSMGGGAAFLAAQQDPTITAFATLAAAETNPSAINAAKNISMPALVFSGGDDCVTPPANHQIPMYDSLASNCKTFISIIDGSHCQFASNNFNCNLGEGTCNPVPAITRAAQQSTTFSLLLPWLNFYLKNNSGSGVQFQNSLANPVGFSSQQNCSLTQTTALETLQKEEIHLYPNPATKHIRLQLGTDSAENIQISSMDGKVLISQSNYSNNEEISVAQLPVGIYVVRVKTKNSSSTLLLQVLQ